jgi:hypothetical protein
VPSKSYALDDWWLIFFLTQCGPAPLDSLGKKEKEPTPEEAIQKLKETEKILIKKQEFLEQKIQQELQTAKKHGTKNKRGNEGKEPLGRAQIGSKSF